MKYLATISFVAILASVAACGDDNGASPEESASTLSLDSTDQAREESALIWSGVAGAEQPPGVGAPTLEQVAAEVAFNLEQRYTPSDCIEVDRLGVSVTATLDRCTGPYAVPSGSNLRTTYGVRALSGELQIDVTSIVDNVVGLSATATGFTSGGAEFDFSAAATYTADGANSTLQVASEATGEGVRGSEFTRTGDYIATWNQDCVTLDGTWEFTVDEATRETTIDIERCADTCPTGTIHIAMLSGGTLHFEFDGSSTVTWSLGGRSGSIEFVCLEG